MPKAKAGVVVNPGDVFIAKLADGRYTAVRVIRQRLKSWLVCTTPYLDAARPSLDDPRLREVVSQRRFYYKGQPAKTWLDGAPTANFELLGNVPRTKAEANMKCDTYSGKWCETTGDEAFLEWRWEHDRAAFEEEVRKEEEESERRQRRPHKPKKMMDEKEFWAIIARLDWKHQGNDKKVLAPAIAALAAKSKTEICWFAERFAFLLYQLDTKAHAGHIGEEAYDAETEYLSADGFLYARCVVVANGRKFYESVLKDPRKMPKDMEFESLLYLAPTAYEQKTSEDFEYTTGCSFESFSNAAGWGQEE